MPSKELHAKHIKGCSVVAWDGQIAILLAARSLELSTANRKISPIKQSSSSGPGYAKIEVMETYTSAAASAKTKMRRCLQIGTSKQGSVYQQQHNSP
jgi:hypothetical protein